MSVLKPKDAAASSEAVRKIAKPERWDVPFCEEMAEAELSRVQQTAFFAEIDASRFPEHIPLDGIILNDMRIRRLEDGEIIVREGDYGSSAFYVLSGSVRVLLQSIPVDFLGRKETEKKSLWGAMTQFFKQSPYVEVRDYGGGRSGSHEGQKPTTHLFLQDIPGMFDTDKSTVLEEGSFFGELGALGRIPRSSTVIANGPVEVVEIRWQGLRELRNYAPDWKAYIDRLYRERSLNTHLRHTPLLTGLSDEALQRIADDTQFLTFGNFDWQGEYKAHASASSDKRLQIEPIIVQEGNYVNGLFLIRNGFARVSCKYNYGERTLRYLGKGEVFGLSELGGHWLHQKALLPRHSLRAIGYVDVLFIPTATVEKYIFPQWDPEVLDQLVAKELAAQPSPEDGGEDSLPDDILEFLVENRTINGTATMLIDMERCTRCDDCVRACASTHENNPRFIRNGPLVGGVMVANACMHCVDPVCMIGCPTGAIHRETLQGQVVINDDTCIGCSTCANSCPYHNIHMVPVRNEDGEPILDESTKAPIQKATKCDLCVEQLGGPACARACPHDAMIRADMGDFDAVARFFER